MFEVAEAYEQILGRWSRQLAPLFVDFVGVTEGETVLDVGCGTGSLSATLAVTGASKIVGIDPSKGFIEYARTQISDPRVTFDVGDAENLSYPNDSFDRAMDLLVVGFLPDPGEGGERKAARYKIGRCCSNRNLGPQLGKRTQRLFVDGRDGNRSKRLSGLPRD